MILMTRALGALLLVFAGLISTLWAAGQLPLPISEVEVGFDGHHKVGHWTPVRIRLSSEVNRSRESRLALVTSDGDGVRAYYGKQLGDELGSGASADGGPLDVLRYVKFGRLSSGLSVQLLENDEVVASRTFTAAQLPKKALSTHQLIVTIGAPAGVEDALALRRRRERESVRTVTIENVSGLPDQWYGYDSVDVLVLTTGTEAVSQLSTAQLEAIERWVRLGGQLILSVGSRGQELLGPGGPLSELLPGSFEGVARQTQTSALETFAEATERLDLRASAVDLAGIAVAQLGSPRGRVLVEEDLRGAPPRPLIVAAPYGFGQITFVAFELDVPPLAGWQGRARLVGRLLQFTTPASQERSVDEAVAQVTHIGYDDLAGQLRSALDQFSQVFLVPFALVAGLVVLYILLIGPADYLLVKRSGRLSWAWVSFPLMVLLFCALAYVLEVTLKGGQLRVNQVDVVDVDLASSTVRGTTWANIYSPRTQSFDLRLDPVRLAPQAGNSSVLLSWQGLPGKGLGGLNTSATAAFFDRGYWIFTDLVEQGRVGGAMIDMPIQVASTKSITGRWWRRQEFSDQLGQLTVDANGLLSGLVANPLPIELSDARLFYENWAYELEQNLQAGDVVRVDNLRKRILDWQLTRRRLVDASNISAAPNVPWDPASTDIPRILEMMMFHQAAGGQAYTQLTHRYQAYVDLSFQLQQGRAVLWGRSAAPGSQLLVHGQPLADHHDNHWTYYRIILPVAPQTRELPET